MFILCNHPNTFFFLSTFLFQPAKIYLTCVSYLTNYLNLQKKKFINATNNVPDPEFYIVLQWNRLVAYLEVNLSTLSVLSLLQLLHLPVKKKYIYKIILKLLKLKISISQKLKLVGTNFTTAPNDPF